MEAANRFLESDLPIYNRRVAVLPAQAAVLHRPRPAHRELDRTLCLKTTRYLRKNFTIAYQGDSIRFMRRSGSPTCWWRARGRNDADHAPGTDARRLRDHVAAREGCDGETVLRPRQPSHAEAGASVAPTPAAGAPHTSDSGANIIQTFLLWEKEGTVSSYKCNG